MVFRIVDYSGKSRQKVLCGFNSKAAAKRGYTVFVSKHCDPLPTRLEPVTKGITIKEAYAKYMSIKAGELKESSVVSIDTVFRRHILPSLGEKDIKEISRQDAILFVDELCAKRQPNGKEYSRKYLKNIRTFIHSLYEWLGARYGVNNPFSKVNVPKSTKHAVQPKIVFWEREEFERFLAVVDDPLYKALFATLFFSGCRKSEAFALSPKDYNADSLHINKTISRKTTDGSAYKVTPNKNAKDYFIPVCAPLKKILDDYAANYVDPSKQFFFGGNAPLPPTSVQRVFDKYISAAGVTPIKIHGLRHSFVSLCVHFGANYMVIADLICDSPEQVLRTYGHLWDSDKRVVIAKIK